MPITVKDVAVTAEVSLGTVSRVLNGDPSVSTDVRQRVRRAVETLGYTRLRSRGRTRPIAASIRRRTGENWSLSTAMTAFVSRQIIRQTSCVQAAWEAAGVRCA